MTNLYPSSSKRIRTGCGNLYCTLDLDPETLKIIRVRVNLGKGGGCAHSWCDVVSELIQLLVDKQTPPEQIAEKMGGHRCQESVFNGALSCGDGIAHNIVKQYNDLVEHATQPQFDAWLDILKERKRI